MAGTMLDSSQESLGFKFRRGNHVRFRPRSRYHKNIINRKEFEASAGWQQSIPLPTLRDKLDAETTTDCRSRSNRVRVT